MYKHFLSRLVLVVAAILTCSTITASTLYLQDDRQLFTLDQTNLALTLVGVDTNNSSKSLTSDWRADSFRLWAVGQHSDYLLQIDPSNNHGTSIGYFSQSIRSIAFDVTTDQLYGISNDTLYRVDLNTAALTPVGPTNQDVVAIAFDTLGNLYGRSGWFTFKVDKLTGAATIVGQDHPDYGGYLAARPEDNAMFIADPLRKWFFQVNTTTGKGTLVGYIIHPSYFGASGLAFSALPEPSTLALLSAAASLILAARSKRLV